MSADPGGRDGAMPPVPLLFEELTRVELREIAPAALAVLPVGATEQHGPHLPSGTDAMHAEHVARAAAAQIAARTPVVVTPTLAFGSSPHHLPFGATLSLTSQTFSSVLHDLCTSLIGTGFRQIFILNGHGGNHELIQIVARDLALADPVSVAAGSWWSIAWDALVAGGACEAGPLPATPGRSRPRSSSLCGPSWCMSRGRTGTTFRPATPAATRRRTGQRPRTRG